jgi:hypothetical protein
VVRVIRKCILCIFLRFFSYVEVRIKNQSQHYKTKVIKVQVRDFFIKILNRTQDVHVGTKSSFYTQAIHSMMFYYLRSTTTTFSQQTS